MYAFVLQLSLVADDLTELAGTILGPPDTPYEGGTYKLEIKIPDTYPFNPPRVRFITKVFHNLIKIFVNSFLKISFPLYKNCAHKNIYAHNYRFGTPIYQVLLEPFVWTS